jgi:hypothetical protein
MRLPKSSIFLKSNFNVKTLLFFILLRELKISTSIVIFSNCSIL